MIKINDLLAQLMDEVKRELYSAYDTEETLEDSIKINRLEEIDESLFEVCTLVREINLPKTKLNHD